MAGHPGALSSELRHAAKLTRKLNNQYRINVIFVSGAFIIIRNPSMKRPPQLLNQRMSAIVKGRPITCDRGTLDNSA